MLYICGTALLLSPLHGALLPIYRRDVPTLWHSTFQFILAGVSGVHLKIRLYTHKFSQHVSPWYICLLTWPSWMSAFGHRSAKPSRGWGNASVPHICVLWGGGIWHCTSKLSWLLKRSKRGSLKSLIDWLRPYIPRLFLRMTLKLRKKLGLSSSGVTIKKKDPKTGKVLCHLPHDFRFPLCVLINFGFGMRANFWHNSSAEVGRTRA